MRPTDIELLPVLGRPTLSSDGRLAVIDVTTPSIEADDYSSELWLVDTSGAAPPQRLTDGPQDGSAVFSPDGQRLAFLRPGPDGRVQIWVMSMKDGAVRAVTANRLGAGQPVWSPDSSLIAHTGRVAEAGRYNGSPDTEAPRRITSLTYFLDGFGYTVDRPRQIFIVDPLAAEPTATQITFGGYDHGDLSWSPDGEEIVFVSGRHDTWKDDPRRDIWACHVDGTGLRPLTRGGMYLFATRVSPDGETVYFAGAPLDEDGHTNATSSYGLWSVPISGGKPPRLETDRQLHLSFASQLIMPARDGVYFASDHRGEVNLVLVPYDGSECRRVIAGPRQVNGYAVAETPSGPVIAAVVASAQSAGDLVVVDRGGERVLTSYGSQLVHQARLMPVERLAATAPDGYELEGWVVMPTGPGPHPVILQIKGGPFTQFGYTLNGPAAFDEAQVYADAGYAVVLGNPRGCSGYGQGHGSYVDGALPRRSADDLLALLDTALRHAALDETRVGMMGGSFGGYMSAWMSAHHGDRFVAAIGERGLYAIDSYLATSDDGVELVYALYGSDRQRWPQMSPLTFVDQMRIPMMLIHSELDRHCPVEQAQRLFVELKLRQVEVEMLLFPGEGHDMSRTGLPSHRIARFEAILEWWSRHLRTQESRQAD